MNYFVTLEPYSDLAFTTYVRPYTPGYEATRDQVGGWIESVQAWTLFPGHLVDDLTAWVDEEGLLKDDLKICLVMFGPNRQVQPIYGNVVFDSIDEEGESHGFNAEQVARLLDAIEDTPYEKELLFEGCRMDNIIFDHHPKDPPRKYPFRLRRQPRRRKKG